MLHRCPSGAAAARQNFAQRFCFSFSWIDASAEPWAPSAAASADRAAASFRATCTFEELPYRLPAARHLWEGLQFTPALPAVTEHAPSSAIHA